MPGKSEKIELLDKVTPKLLERIAVASERIADSMERVVTLFERLLEDGLPGRR